MTLEEETPQDPVKPKPIEMHLMEQANDAVKQGADPHQATEMLGAMIKHLRANPNVATYANGALAQGADPHQVSSKIWELTNAQPEVPPSLQERAGTMIRGAAAQAFHHPLETAASMVTTPIKSAMTALRGASEQEAQNVISSSGGPLDAVERTVSPKEGAMAALQTGANLILPSVIGKVGGGLIKAGANRIAAGAAGAGVGGAVGGAAYSPNDPLAGAAAGGVMGSVTGAAAPPVARVAGMGKRAVGSALSRVAPDAEAASATPLTTAAAGGAPRLPAPEGGRATSLLLQRMQRAGLTPSDAIARLGEVPADKPITVMELAGEQSHPVRQLGKLVARTPSAGAAQLRADIGARSAPLPNAQRVLGDVGEAMGVQRMNMVDQGQKLSGQRLAAAQPHYAAADEAPPVPMDMQASNDGPTLAEIMKRPSIKAAVNFHNDVAAERGEAPLKLPSDKPTEPPPPPPGFAPEQWAEVLKKANEQGIELPGHEGEMPTEIPLKTLQQIKFKLDETLGFAKRHGQLPDGTAATNAKLGAINETRLALLDIMGQHSPEYAAGNEVWAGKSALLNAGEQGREFLSSPIDELQANLRKMTQGEREQHNVSALSGPIRDRLYKTSAVDRAKILTQPDITERLQAVVPPDQMPTLLRNAGHEHQMAVTNQAITGGSDTAENLLNQFDAGGHVQKALTTLATHGPSRAAAQLFKNVLESKMAARMQGVNERTSNQLSPMLTAGIKSRADAQALLQALDRQFKLDAQRRSAIPRTGVAAGAATGSLVGQQP